MSVPVDLERLRRLRDGFLAAGERGGRGLSDYWRDAEDLEQYDAVFAQRIGWKWDAVLDELEQRDVLPAAGHVVDFGCGSGVASRCVVERIGATAVSLHDRSALARDHASRRLRDLRPDLAVEAVPWVDQLRPDLLLISHVLDELAPAARDELLALVRRSAAVLWVEAGTQSVGRELARLRDELLAAGEFRVLAPCTHQLACPALPDRGDGRQHWCHFFASPPSEVFADPDWVRLGRELGIDLRALPYSFLALDRSASAAQDDGRARLLGRPRLGSKVTRYWACDREGLHEREAVKSRDRALHKALKKDAASLRLL